MEPLISHLHVPSCFDDEDGGGDVFLTLSCGSSSSEAAAAAGKPPRVLRRGRRHRRRGKHQQGSSSFDCRTCGREFPTFQALGGHRTSHLLRRPTKTTTKNKPPRSSSKAVLMVHACAACGLGFSTGQALGGHMRRHRGGGPSTIDATEEEEGCGGPDYVYAVDLAWAVVLHEKPRSTAPLRLLDLFV